MQLTTGHTVDPMVVVREQTAAKRARVRRLIDEGWLTDAALLQRRCERLAEQGARVRAYRARTRQATTQLEILTLSATSD